MSELQKQLGALLKSERERQEILIGDIAEKLKIAEANLAAIENGDISSLPSEIYFSLFSKTYAEALGIDYATVMDELKGKVAEVEDQSKKTVHKKKTDSAEVDEEAEKPKQNNFVKTAGIAFGGIVLVFILFLLFNNLFLKSDESMSSEDSMNSMNTEAPLKKSESEMEALYADYDWESVVYEKPEKLQLTLVATEQCWSAIFADGDTALYQNLRPNRLYTIDADYRILVSVGMPSKVTIKLNGQEVDLRNSESRRIYKVLINQLNYKEYLNPEPIEPAKKATSPSPSVSQDKPLQVDDAVSDTLTQQEQLPDTTEQNETGF